ncbi:leucine rich repeat-containing protein, putative [Babesia ovata]|uniref:Leucine rich repeat-containing protein, putative n=1 Tax=Babesia ovata TaxID=189622 RepID=A0A2H6KG51_9APIC|nr:leucine rich repeat-containing protein, putative [Babesia ovata]GBE61939.1 leucine rich repeat-containing protein, putative [Babesia ovata]
MDPAGFAPVCRELYSLAVLERPEVCVPRGIQLGVRSERLLNTVFKCVCVRLLDVSGWERWNDRLVQRLALCHRMGQFRCLRALLMRGCNEISNNAVSGLLDALGGELHYLDLSDCAKLGSACLPPTLNNLKVLLIGFQRKRGNLADGDLMAHIVGGKRVFTPRLEWLSLQHRLEVKSLRGIGRLAPTLRVLDLRGCSEIPPEEYTHCASLARLEELYAGTALTSEVLCNIAKGCRALRVLDVSGSDVSPDCVNAICSHLKALEKLKLAKCTALTNQDICRLLESLPMLSLLDVSHCWKLSDSLANTLPPIASKGELNLGVYNCSIDHTRLAMAIEDRRAPTSGPVRILRHQELNVLPSAKYVRE